MVWIYLPPKVRLQSQLFVTNSFVGICSIALLILFALQGCRKADFESNNSDKFDVAAAKEWWYGTFVKSSEYLGAVRSQSKRDNGEVASRKRLLATSVATNNKLPSWKGGKSFAIGRLKFVELPLVMSHRVLYLPTKPGETDAHRLKVAENSLQKLIIVQKTDGRYFTRIVTIIPSLDYLSKMQFNLREFSLEHIPAEFEGIINVSDWNESQVANWLYKEGKRKRVKIEPRQQNERGRKKLLREVPCPPEYGIVGYHKYCIVVSNPVGHTLLLIGDNIILQRT